MSRSQAIALLLMAACVALAAAKPTLRPMYEDWLAEQTGEAKIAADDASEYSDYPRLEHETVCLKATAFEYADCGYHEACDTVNFLTKVACCNGIQTNGNYYPDDDPEDVIPSPVVPVGSCTTTVIPFYDPVQIETTDNYKLGTFTTLCSIPHGSLCGAPFCSDLQLVQEGIVVVGQAVSKTDPRISPPENWAYDELPVLSTYLFDSFFSDDIIQPRKPHNRTDVRRARKVPKARKVHAMSGAETEGYGYGGDSYIHTPPPPPSTTTWYKGFIECYTGPVTIYSKKHAFKYHFGHMEFTNWAGNTTQVSTKGNLPVVNPFTFTLKMNVPQGY